MSRYPSLGAPFDIIHQNLDELDRRLGHVLECRLAHIDAWADAAARAAGGERDVMLRLLNAARPGPADAPDYDSIPPENDEAVRQGFHALSAYERLAVLRAVIDRVDVEALMDVNDTTGGAEDVSEHAADKIAYVQNTFSDSAYLRFSAHLTRPRASYFDSFAGVCEEVYNGICEYCILPILHDRDGKLFRFYDLLEKYELRIVDACDVPRTEKDGVTVTRYALLCRELRPPVTDEPFTHMELCLPTDGDISLCELLPVAHACGITPERIDTRGDSEAPDVLTHRITLRLDGADLRVFLAYLTLDVPRCTVLGLYSVTPYLP